MREGEGKLAAARTPKRERISQIIEAAEERDTDISLKDIKVADVLESESPDNGSTNRAFLLR